MPFWGVALYAVLAGLLLRDIVVGPVPAFHHDWIWPYLRPGFSSVVSYGIAPWLPGDLGAPNLYPTLLPLLAVQASLLQIFGVKGALLVLLMALYVVGALGTCVLVRRIGVRAGWAFVAGAFYMTAPALFVQLVAGHLGDIAVYASCPWLVAAFRREGGVLHSLLCASLAAMCCSVQPQGFVIAIVVVAVCSAVLWNRNAAAIAVGAAVAACGSICATLYGLLTPIRQHAQFISQEHAVLSWTRAQSSPLSEAVAARGYFAAYDNAKLFSGLHPYVNWALAAVVAGLLLFAYVRRSRIMVALCVIYAIGVLIISGVSGPVGGAWTYAFEHVDAASLFRELFHAAPLVTLPLCVAVAVCAEMTWQHHRKRARVVAAIAVAFLFSTNADPALGGTSAYLHGHVASPVERAFYEKLASSSDASRFAVFPGRQPYDFHESTGVDPLSYYPIGAHKPIFGYFPASIVAFAGDEWLNGNTAVAFSAYRRMGVRYLLIRRLPAASGERQIPPTDRVPQLSVRPKLPAQDRIFVLDANPLVRVGQVPLVMGGDLGELQHVPRQRVVAFLRQKPQFLNVTQAYELAGASTQDVAIGAGCASVWHLHPSSVSANPADAWVDGARYGIAMPEIDAALTRPVLTVGKPPLNNIPRGSVFLSISGHGRYAWGSTATNYRGFRVIAAAITPQPFNCTIHPGVRSANPPKITSILPGDSAHGTFLSFGNAGSFALSENYDSDWALEIDGRRVDERDHFVADGYANGWIVDAPRGMHRFAFRYEPARLFRLLLCVQILTWIVVTSGYVLKKIV